MQCIFTSRNNSVRGVTVGSDCVGVPVPATLPGPGQSAPGQDCGEKFPFPLMRPISLSISSPALLFLLWLWLLNAAKQVEYGIRFIHYSLLLRAQEHYALIALPLRPYHHYYLLHFFRRKPRGPLRYYNILFHSEFRCKSNPSWHLHVVSVALSPVPTPQISAVPDRSTVEEPISTERVSG